MAQACFADLRKTLCPDDVGVLPLGETALARQFRILGSEGLETSQPRPMMTGPTKTEERRGIKLSHRRDREFSRSPEGVRTVSRSSDMGFEQRPIIELLETYITLTENSHIEPMPEAQIDTASEVGIMTAEEVAQLLAKSTSWVYKHWQLLGGVKLGGSLFFPTMEDLYERLFNKGQRVAVRLHTEEREVHPSLVQNQNRGQKGRSRQEKGGTESAERNSDPNRHGLLGVGEQAA